MTFELRKTVHISFVIGIALLRDYFLKRKPQLSFNFNTDDAGQCMLISPVGHNNLYHHRYIIAACRVYQMFSSGND